MIENLLNNYKQRKKIFLAIILVLVSFYILAVYITYNFNKENLYENVDKLLKNSAYAIDGFLEKDFHDKAISQDAISKEQDQANIAKLSKFAQKSDIEYLYTMIKKDNKVYFTSSSATQEDFEEDLVTYYFDPYDSATQKLKDTFESNTIVYEESTDKWGTFRSVFIPITSKNGNRYILGADIKIDFIDEQLKKFIFDSIVVFILLIVLTIIIFSLIKKINKKEIELIHTVETSLKNEIYQKELRLFEQTKMAAMGEMIGNIAHQWRQPLNAISTVSSGMLFLKENELLNDEQFHQYIQDININVLYLSETIDTFRNFLIEDKHYQEVILQERIDHALQILHASLEQNQITLINLCNEYEPIKVKIILGELTQILINIINNSQDILKEKQIQNPWIEIDLEKDEQKVIITIEDNGGGIPNEIISNIFEPYFTTKHKAKGTGLGLYMSYKIVTESLKGKLYVENTQNGAKFFVEIPL